MKGDDSPIPKRPEHLGNWVAGFVRKFVATSTENALGLPTGEKAFDMPLVGFASGGDSIWDEYRAHIGSFYFSPVSLFLKSFPREVVAADELSVISWILPSTRITRQEQAAATRYPSERWARTRYYGELFNNALRRHVVEKLVDEGIEAVVPLLSSAWGRSDEGPYAPCSNWSERHAAYAAGLGAFGLCDGLITPVGKAHRTGSVIARIRVQATDRPYPDHHATCLHFTHDSCRKCIARCPVKALSERGHDKNKCMEYTERRMNAYIKKTYDIDTYACGLCQCGVPCTDHEPEEQEG